MEAVRKLDEYYTYEDYYKWDDDNRWELIDGVPYLMAPAPSYRHQSVSVELTRQLSNFLKENPCKVLAAPVDVRLNADDKDDTVVQPDIIVVCDEAKFEKSGRSVVGAPDFVVEILSPSTAKRDWITKKKLYQKYGVKEYWIVDIGIKGVMTHVLVDNVGYISQSYGEHDDAVPVAVLEGCTINLTDVFEGIE